MEEHLHCTHTHASNYSPTHPLPTEEKKEEWEKAALEAKLDEDAGTNSQQSTR